MNSDTVVLKFYKSHCLIVEAASFKVQRGETRRSSFLFERISAADSSFSVILSSTGASSSGINTVNLPSTAARLQPVAPPAMVRTFDSRR